MKKNSFIPLPPFKGWVLQNFPFIEEDFDAITSYQLWCKVVEYLRGINSNVNVLAEEVLDLKNYIDSLDIQEYVNEKLDEMAESGQLTDIIAQYLQLAGILAFNTVNDLANAENLNNGSFAKTYGKLTYNDGYGAFYKIRGILNTDIIDNDNIVALINFPELVAEKIPDAIVNGLVEDVNDLKEDVEELNNYMDYQLENERYVNHFRYYLDGVNGDDENDGLSSTTAFKTIDRFLLEANKRSDIRCYIISAGTYTCTKKEISDTVIHITSNLANRSDVIIDSFPVVYNSHVNFQNLTFTHTDTSKDAMYLENCATMINNCYIDFAFTFWGGYFTYQYSTLNCIICHGATGLFGTIVIDGKLKQDAIVIDRGSNIEFSGTVTVQELENPNARYILAVTGSTIFYHASTTVSSGVYTYTNGLRLAQAIATISQGSINSLSPTSLARCLMITDNVQLPS